MQFYSFDMIIDYINECHRKYCQFERELDTLSKNPFSSDRVRVKEIKMELKK